MNDVQTVREHARARWGHRRIVVVGAGCSGVAAARLLLDCGARVTLNDSRPVEQIADAAEIAARGAELIGGGHPADIWQGADVAVFSPGIRPDAEVSRAARDAGVTIIPEIEVAASVVEAPIIAITGSNGKSTVTSMVGAMLSAAGLNAPVCGNIGRALSDAAHDEVVGGTRPDAYVVEISSFQAHGIIDFHPHLAALLNLQPDHIDWHGSFEAYADAKLRLIGNMEPADWVVYNHHDEAIVGRLAGSAAGKAPFADRPGGMHPPAAWISDGCIWWWGADAQPRTVIEIDALPVIGPHNHANACAATALAALFKAPFEGILAGLTRYRPLEHRMEPCGSIAGVACINDSKATNVDATLAALSGFERGVWLILGGRDKDADFAQLAPLLDARVSGILLIGEATDAIEDALRRAEAHRAGDPAGRANPAGPIRPEGPSDLTDASGSTGSTGPTGPSIADRLHRCETMERAVELALTAAAAGDTLLLSPACTSFDQYPNFEARGRHFKALVAARAAGAEGAAVPVPEAP